MITFEKMDAETFGRYLPHLLEGYSKELSESMDMPLHEAQERAAAQTSQLLPQGADTPNHYLFVLHADGEPQQAGYLWVFVDPPRKRAFIYDIEIAEDQRGRGMGRLTLRALDDFLRSMGVRVVELHVFSNNPAALHLYLSEGYQAFSMNMRKEL